MTYLGKVTNGVVVLDGAPQLPDGAPVRVELIEERPLMALIRRIENLPSDPDWPPDGAAEHDHYLYGTPNRGR